MVYVWLVRRHIPTAITAVDDIFKLAVSNWTGPHLATPPRSDFLVLAIIRARRTDFEEVFKQSTVKELALHNH